MESKYPVINLKLNGANQRLIGLAYQTIAKELNTDENLVDAIDNQALDPTCLVYIYPNAKRLTFQQRLLTTMLNAKRNDANDNKYLAEYSKMLLEICMDEQASIW